MNLFNSKDLEKGSKSIDYKIPYAKLEESKVYGGWGELALKEQQLPDNVIRIETLDGSEEFIEIEFDENSSNATHSDEVNEEELDILYDGAKELLYELSPLSSIKSSYENLSASEYTKALLEASTALPPLKAIKAKKLAAKIEQVYDKLTRKKVIKKLKSKYITKQEVLDVIKNKYKLKTSKELNKMGHKQFLDNENVFMAKDNQQIKEIWEDIIEWAEVLKDAMDKKTGEKIKMRKLSDGTILKLRKKSTSGGSAIDIGNKGEKKIHNKEKEDGDW